MTVFRELSAALAAAAIAAVLIAALSLIQSLRPAPENDMRTVEALLVSHGLPVEGFAATPPVNLEAIDTMSPPECAGVLRKAYLAKLAVIRMAPDRAADAGGISRAVRFAYAQEAGVPECAP